MTFSFEKKLILSFAVLLTGIVAAGIATYKNNQSAVETDYWVQHTREVLYESSELLSDVQDIVLGTSGYIITGNSAFLQPVDNSIGRISENGEKLENLVKDNAGQQQRVDSVRKLMDKLIQYSLQLIELRNSKGFAEAQQLIASREGKFYMDEIRSAVRTIQQEENKLLSERQAAHLKASAAYNRSFYLLMGTLMGLLMLVLFAVNYNLRVRKKAEDNLIKLKKELDLIFNSVQDGIQGINKDGIIIFENPAASQMLGWDPKDLIGKPAHATIHHTYPSGAPYPVSECSICATLKDGRVRNVENELFWRKDGTSFPVYYTSSPMRNEASEITGAIVTFHDITEKKKAEEQIKKMNAVLEKKVEERTRLYHFISQINAMIVHVKDEETLFRDTCRIAVDAGKFKMAWIGVMDKNGILIRRSLAGGESVIKKIFKSSLDPNDPASQNIPAVKVLKTGKYEFNTDVPNDPWLVASKDELASLGIHSSISLPIFKFGKVVGILGAYGGEKDFLDEAEISLLEEVAGGISFALENVEKEEERKITGEAIRESNERFLHATRASGEIIYEWRINEDKVWWSEQFFKLMKIEEKTPWQATSSWTDIIHPDDREAVVNNLNEFLEDKGSLWQCQYRVINKEGRTFHWDDRGYVLRDNNGKAYLMIGAITDMTDWKKSEQKLEQQYKELEKTNIELDRFVYSTSHDLRAPLKSMLGLIKLTKADAEPGNRELHKRLDMLNKSVTRLDDFIEEILDYSRNARLEVAKDEINFEELIQEIRANHKFMEEAKGLNLQVKIQQQGKFVSDKRRLKVVLNNLISNAIKYSDVSKEKSFVKIFVECRGENAIATVEDNGIGIAEKDKVKIFEMFYRASTLSSGSGLGLYIVKETIEKLGGAIYLESELNKGTKFTVTIPNLIID